MSKPAPRVGRCVTKEVRAQPKFDPWFLSSPENLRVSESLPALQDLTVPGGKWKPRGNEVSHHLFIEQKWFGESNWTSPS